MCQNIKNMKILSIILASMLVGSAYGIAQEAPAPKQDKQPLVTENQRGPRGPMNGQGFRGGQKGKPAKICPACGQPIMKKGPMKGGPKGSRGPKGNPPPAPADKK